MDFDAFVAREDERRSNFGRELLRLWDEGRGDVELVGRHANSLRGYMRDPDVVRLHLAAVERVAAGSVIVPEVHRVLFELYLSGTGVNADPTRAVHHLHKAVEGGDKTALKLLGAYLLSDDTKLSSALPQDVERGLTILCGIAKNERDWSLAHSATCVAASHLVRNSSYLDMSEEERQMVEAYASDRAYILTWDYAPLARYYEGKVGTSDYVGPSYQKIRDLLLEGAESHNESTRNACNTVLDEWGVRPQLPPPKTAAQKAGDALKVTGAVGGIGLSLWLWSVIGITLLSLTAMVSAITIPIILIGLAIGAVVKSLRR